MTTHALRACARVRNNLVKHRHLPLTRFIGCTHTAVPLDFEFHPNFFSIPEQRILLTAALHKLDATESRQSRRRRKDYRSSQNSPGTSDESSSVQSLFLPDEFYEFQQGHYDGVITRFREMHISSWPQETAALPSLLARLRALHPDQETQTHILHLASDGEIFPHVDNIEASGTWILGVSLGAGRILHLESTVGEQPSYDFLLPSGSVYMQKDSIRYGYKHSVLKMGVLDGVRHYGGQRLSIMIRDRLPVRQTS